MFVSFLGGWAVRSMAVSLGYPPSSHTHRLTHLPSVKCMEALRHTACICRLHGCVAQRSKAERKIGGGEGLQQESRRRREDSFLSVTHEHTTGKAEKREQK